MEEKATERQVGGSHYKKCKIQPIEYIHANGLDFFQGNIVKYITRFREKGKLEDIRKIKHYCDLLIELEEKNITNPPFEPIQYEGKVSFVPANKLEFQIPVDENTKLL